MFPTSLVGRLLGTLTMLMGILVLALPVTIIGTNVSRIHHELHQQGLETEQRGLLQLWRSTTREKAQPRHSPPRPACASTGGADGKALAGASGQPLALEHGAGSGGAGLGGVALGGAASLEALAREVHALKHAVARVESYLGEMQVAAARSERVRAAVNTHAHP